MSVWHDTLRLEPTSGPGPVSRWKAAHVTWPPSGLDRFATFLRARPYGKEPPLFLAHGRGRCNKHAMRLWSNRAQSAVAHLVLRAQHKMLVTGTWFLLRNWNRIKSPSCAPPMHVIKIHAMAKQALLDKEADI